jgi:hypothetical protein
MLELPINMAKYESRDCMDHSVLTRFPEEADNRSVGLRIVFKRAIIPQKMFELQNTDNIYAPGVFYSK